MEERYIVQPNFLVRQNDADPYMIRHSFDDQELAVACSDGNIRIYNAQSGSFLTNFNCQIGDDVIPVTSVSWLPNSTQKLLLATTAVGGVFHWDVRNSFLAHKLVLENNQALCSDVNSAGTRFAVGCKDSTVRVFDEEEKQETGVCLEGEGERLGHANRVMAVKWLDENTLASGGWDNNIFIWDLRTCKTVRYLHGPHISGDSIDVKDNFLLTGSYSPTQPLQVWDWTLGQCLHSQNLGNEGQPLMVFAAGYSKHDHGGMVACGGAGTQELHFFRSRNLERFDMIENVSHTVYCLDFANDKPRLCVGSSDRTLKFFEVTLAE